MLFRSYIRSVTLNCAPLTRSYLRDDEIRQGGELRFVMGAQPNKLWGKGAKARPFSSSTAGSNGPARTDMRRLGDNPTTRRQRDQNTTSASNTRGNIN